MYKDYIILYNIIFFVKKPIIRFIIIILFFNYLFLRIYYNQYYKVIDNFKYIKLLL